ncbi:dihydroorotase [Anaeromicropila populeti]|uniref:Dihydroorotase n=1 Tax=Anaeromicropila populeti TaxID=37658 RepID=A0A1I6LJ49_9FIRM|nr:dihydroorotase [Anaeromicropila populeti]SFS03495.1 dihydroorotase [Anaeromicropila populeti]
MILIKNGKIVDPASGFCQVGDLAIEDSKIVELGTGLDESLFDTIIDAKGMTVAPGFIDVHVHFRDPGYTYKEDIQTGAMAAKKGGYTTVITMANTNPPVDHVETLQYILEEGKKTGIHVLPAASVSKGLKGEELVEMEQLKQAGAVGFTDDGFPLSDEKLVVAAMEEAKRLQLPLSFHEEDPTFIKNAGVNQGAVAKKMGLAGAASIAEDLLVARDGLLALHTGCTINIQHISSKNAVKLVRQLKEMGANIYAEATPHHFSLDETAVLKYQTLAKMNPPLRTKEDQEEIIKGLQDGTIDLIATDHAPHSKEEKEREFTKAPSGIIGLETALALGITNLVKTGKLTINELMEKMSLNPSRLYHLNKGTIQIGADADIVLFSEDKTVVVKEFVSKADNSPFIGQTLYGKVEYTICQGRIVYQAE